MTIKISFFYRLNKKKALIYLQIIFFLTIHFAISSCKQNSTPKPLGYFRITLPEKKEYVIYNSECPFRFEYPIYSKIEYDSSQKANPCWMNIVFNQFNGQIHLSYKKVENNASEYCEESRNLAFKHSVKADAIGEKSFADQNKRVFGVLYDIKGNAASSYQFYLTDSTNHFVRGALYFNVYPNKDSLAPVIDFLKTDIIKIIESFEWKNN